MVELVGDICEPSEFILPKLEHTLTLSAISISTVSEGFLFLSGAKLWFHNGTNVVVVTSG